MLVPSANFDHTVGTLPPIFPPGILQPEYYGIRFTFYVQVCCGTGGLGPHW